MLDRLLRRSPALNRDYFYFGTTNEFNLHETLQDKKIKTVVPLGERALRQLIGEGNIERWRGRITTMRGLPDITVVPTFAPSKLLPNRGDDNDGEKMRHPPRFHGAWMWDVSKALHIAQHGFTRMPTCYLRDPSSEEFTAWALAFFAALRADPTLWLSWDIETPYKMKAGDEGEFEEAESTFADAIIRISFSYREGEAVSVPWSGIYLDTIRQLLASECAKVVWNGSTFDCPKVIANGFHVGGVVYDFMDGWHVFQSDLDKGLEFVSSFCSDILPWKHLSSAEPAEYSCIDSDAALRNANKIAGWLKANGMWDAFMRHSVRLMPILYRAGQHGNLIDIEKQEALKVELDGLRAQLQTDAQPMVPRELRPRQRFKRFPSGIVVEQTPTGVRTVAFPEPVREFEVVKEWADRKFCSHCGLEASNKSEHFKGTSAPFLDADGNAVVAKKTGKPKMVRTANPCKLAGATIITRPAIVDEYDEILDFNPNSSDQMKAYIRHFKHPMGKDKKDASKESADAKHLKDLKKQYGHTHPIYANSIETHLVVKTRGTYCPTPDANSLIHTTYKNNTSTWRLASANLNMQNWGKREGNPYAKRARKQIIARPGHKLVQIDSASVEAVMLGWFMGDRRYMALASKGIHSWLTAMELGIAFTPENVDIIKSKHKKLYDSFKVANHMTNYGGGPGVLYASAPDVFGSKAGATRVQNRIFELLPNLGKFHHEVRIRAQKESYLKNPWGHRHYFYDVFTTGRDGTIRWGKDSKRVVAYLPQSSNGCFQRDNVLLLAATPIDADQPYTDIGWVMANWEALEKEIVAGNTWARFFPANLSVHDSGCLDTPDEYVERLWKEVLVPIFTRPIPEMDNIRIGAEVEIGSNWGDMDSVFKIAIEDYDTQEAALAA